MRVQSGTNRLSIGEWCIGAKILTKRKNSPLKLSKLPPFVQTRGRKVKPSDGNKTYSVSGIFEDMFGIFGIIIIIKKKG